MCDYSATGVKQRAAAKKETLISKRISSHTVGFVGIGDPSTAVCLLPGTELAFESPVCIREQIPLPILESLHILGHGLFSRLGLSRFILRPRSRENDEKMATFIQVNKDRKDMHHDALRFAGDRIVLLTELKEGQKVVVVSLPADPKTLKGVARTQAQAAQRRAAFI